MPKVDLFKGASTVNKPYEDPRAAAINDFMNLLLQDNNEFKAESAFHQLVCYIQKHDRILYSHISNVIYKCYDEHTAEDAERIIASLSSNMDKLLAYSPTPQYSKKYASKSKNPQSKTAIKDARKAIVKIWDHINLAQQQYSVLKQSDEEYQQKFKSLIEPYKTQMTQDMNSQLLTMVSIFTALAFLVFGGISSLDNIFSTQGIPLLKLMCVGSVWGLCILNLIFVFLFCISKMTNLSFKSTNDPNANIFQKYPVIWWTDLMLLSILALCSWAYYVRKNNFDGWLNELFENYRPLVVIAGTLIIVWMICKSVKWLTTKTSYHPQNSNK